jgi:hypothetical protein
VRLSKNKTFAVALVRKPGDRKALNHDQTQKPINVIMHVRTAENNLISPRPDFEREDVALTAQRVFTMALICYFKAMIAPFRFHALAESHP